MDETLLTNQNKINIKINWSWKWAGIIVVGLFVLWNLYYFGWRGLTNHYYQKGYTAGYNKSQQDNAQVVVGNLCQTGQLNVNLPLNCDLTSKETMSVILVPKIATSTK